MKYDKDTMDRLRQSAEKWTACANGEKVKVGSTKNCPLCELFYNKKYKGLCRGCPIADKTGEPGCNNSPYEEWFCVHKTYISYQSVEQPFAKKEAEFLWNLYFELGGKK